MSAVEVDFIVLTQQWNNEHPSLPPDISLVSAPTWRESEFPAESWILGADA